MSNKEYDEAKKEWEDCYIYYDDQKYPPCSINPRTALRMCRQEVSKEHVFFCAVNYIEELKKLIRDITGLPLERFTEATTELILSRIERKNNED